MPKTDRTEALGCLHSTSPHERLSAVREISLDLKASDRPILDAALAVETTAFVKAALKTALEKLRHPELAEPEELEEQSELNRQNSAEWRATREVTGTLLHEILPRVGSIEYEAEKALENYSESKLAAKIRGLKDLMSAMQQLQQVTHPRSPVDFPIYKLLRECVSDENASDVVRYDGNRKLVVIGDPDLLKLAFCNGLRNAVEASSDAQIKQVIVTWGESDVHYFIRVIDSGPGLRGSSNAAMHLGSTTKSGHTGFGLSIARAAMASMDGEIALESNNPTGVIFSMKWYRP